MNAATIVVGLVVAVILIAAVYFSVRSFRSGKCSGCKGCEKGRRK